MLKKIVPGIAILLIIILATSYHFYLKSMEIGIIVNPEGNGAMYFIDTDGNVVSDTPFYGVYEFNEDGIALVSAYYGNRKDYKKVYGYIDSSFSFINDTFWDYGDGEGYTNYNYFEGNYTGVLLRKNSRNDELQIFDTSLNEINRLDGLDLSNAFNWRVSDDGTVLVTTKDGLSGYLDKNGEWIIEPKYTYADIFKKGYAVAGVDGKEGLIDKKGNWQIAPMYETLIYNGDCEILIAEIDDDNCILIDKNGNQVIDRVFEDEELGSGFDSGLCLKRDIYYGYIDKSGEYVIDPQFDDASWFNNGYAYVKDESNEKYAYIDTEGNYITDYLFDEVKYFTEDGLAAVKVNGKWGYIKTDGTWFLEPQFESATSFTEGYAAVWLDKGQNIRK